MNLSRPFRLAFIAIGILATACLVLLAAVSTTSARERDRLVAVALIARDRVSLSRYSAATVTRIVAAAEAEGVAKVSRTDRRCVRVTEADGVAQSGEITSGGWNIYRNSWLVGGGKLWWRAARRGTPPGERSTMTIRAVSLDRPLPVGAESRTTSARINLYPASRRGDTLVFKIDEAAPQTFPSGVRLPLPGSWLLIATIGDNWGCFIYRL